MKRLLNMTQTANDNNGVSSYTTIRPIETVIGHPSERIEAYKVHEAFVAQRETNRTVHAIRKAGMERRKLGRILTRLGL